MCSSTTSTDLVSKGQELQIKKIKQLELNNECRIFFALCVKTQYERAAVPAYSEYADKHITVTFPVAAPQLT